MNSKFFLFLGAGLLTLSLAKAATEQTPFELSCRMKAKEVAAETYRGCVTENRKAQVDQLRSDYQSKLKSLKDEYEVEIKRAAGMPSAQPAPSSDENSTGPQSYSPPPAPRKSSTLKSNKTFAKSSLPPKKKSPRREAPSESNEMNVQLRNSPPVNTDDSSMDIPEPIPVENINGSET